MRDRGNIMEQHKSIGTLENPCAYGSNPDLPGFTASNLDEHWINHKNQYPGLTKAEYAQRAHDLVRSATDENILGYKTSNGSVARYNKTTNDFVQGYKTGIATMFPLKGGEVRFNKKKQRAEVLL
jgi:pyocin large subunit-like protein